MRCSSQEQFCYASFNYIYAPRDRTPSNLLSFTTTSSANQPSSHHSSSPHPPTSWSQPSHRPFTPRSTSLHSTPHQIPKTSSLYNLARTPDEVFLNEHPVKIGHPMRRAIHEQIEWSRPSSNHQRLQLHSKSRHRRIGSSSSSTCQKSIPTRRKLLAT